MKTRGVALQAALAVAGLVGAYFTWQRPPDKTPGAVTIVDATRAEVELVRFEEPGAWVEVRPDPSQEDSAWVRLSAVEPKQASEDGGVAEAGLGRPERLLRGGEAARDLLGKFAPMTASRALGVLEEEKLKELGLLEPKKRLEVTTRDGKRSFAVSTSVLGSGNPYLMDEKSREVFLLGPGILPDLEAADSRLVDRRLHTFRAGEFDTLVVQRGEASREFSAQGRPPQEVQFLPKSGAGAGEPDDFTRNWHSRMWRMNPSEVFGKDEVPEGLASSPELRLSYQDKGRELGFLELAKGADGKYFARSERTAGWVQLHSGAGDILDESVKVLGGGAQ